MVRRIVHAFGLALRAAPGALAGCVALTLFAGLLPVAVAWLTSSLIDYLVTGRSWASPVGLVGLLVLASMAMRVIPHLSQYLFKELDREIGWVALDRLFGALGRQVGLARFENVDFLNQLRLAQQAGGAAANQLVGTVLSAGQAAVTIAGFVASLLVVSPLMTALVVLSGGPLFAAEAVLTRRRVRMIRAVTPTERREAFYNRLLSTVAAAKEVRLFGIADFLRGRMIRDRRSADAAKRTMDRVETVTQVGLGLLSAGVAGAGLAWAIDAARDGRFTAGTVAVFIAATAGVQGTLATLAGHLAQTIYALSLFDHYVALTSAGPDLPLARPARPLRALRRGIELRNVWFRYSDDHPWVLREVNLFIPCGQSVALVGGNGAGKSTLVKLLSRFYDPTVGAILWDGVDIREVDPAELRQRIGAVFQDYMEYDLTARENIAIGDLTALADPARIESAARGAGIHEEILGLPNGYETLLSREFPVDGPAGPAGVGVVLSGGQWQRIALARAFLRADRDLMILDEPSSGLDAQAEERVYAQLRRQPNGRATQLLVSHRLNAVRQADLIVVMAGGQVVEQGGHGALLAAGAEYATLFTAQASGYQPDRERSPSAAQR